MTQPNETLRALAYLGVSPAELEWLNRLPGDEASKKFAALKDKVNKNWRRAAFELHPDRTNNDPEKTAVFKEVLRIKDSFERYTPSSKVMPKGVTVPKQPRRRPATASPNGYKAAHMKP